MNPEKIKKMTKTLVHRGPDDQGYYINGCIGLGFRRLSIIDLEGGHQPMSDKDEVVWVIFNGEIYNFREIRSELEKKGYTFKTCSDTEVIIHGYKEWGMNVFDHLNGMFGLAIWDDLKKKLIIARDAMGIKLLYYKIDKGSIFFGSEIRPILAADGEKSEIDAISLNLFLRYRYTPSPYTLYKGIKKLAAGTMLIAENGETRVERWYTYKPSLFPRPKTEAQAKDELFELYKSALQRHLISDVPLGLLLSGGIDSGLLLGLMNLYGKDWPTFTVGYGKSFKDDELSDAADTAKLFSSKHTSLELDRQTFENTLSEIVSFIEEPIAASSIVPMYFICQRARQDVKVALIGQGPDELFGGYKRHIGLHYGPYYRKMPAWIKSGIKIAVQKLPRNEMLKRGVYALDIENRKKRYQNVFSIIEGEVVNGLFIDGMLPSNADERVLECWDDLFSMLDNTDELGGLQFLEIRSSLPDELLMYADKMSMAHSLEVRVPFLDKEIVEYVQRLPAEYKVRNWSGKWLHRKVCDKFLCPKIMKRRKRGFAVNVVDNWFKLSLTKKIDSLICNPNSIMFGYLKFQEVQKILREHRSGRHNYHKILFSLLIFEEWLRLGKTKDSF